MDEKFAKPQSAYVTMILLRGSSTPAGILPRFRNAMNSLSTIRVPRSWPTIGASFHDTPIAQAIGRKIHPSSVSRLAGKYAAIAGAVPAKIGRASCRERGRNGGGGGGMMR